MLGQPRGEVGAFKGRGHAGGLACGLDCMQLGLQAVSVSAREGKCAHRLALPVLQNLPGKLSQRLGDDDDGGGGVGVVGEASSYNVDGADAVDELGHGLSQVPVHIGVHVGGGVGVSSALLEFFMRPFLRKLQLAAEALHLARGPCGVDGDDVRQQLVDGVDDLHLPVLDDDEVVDDPALFLLEDGSDVVEADGHRGGERQRGRGQLTLNLGQLGFQRVDLMAVPTRGTDGGLFEVGEDIAGEAGPGADALAVGVVGLNGECGLGHGVCSWWSC